VTEALDNSQGQLVAGGNTDLSAKTFNNSTGQLVTSGQLNATVAQALINQQGLISANEALTVKAGSLDNSKGSVASAKDTVSLTATQAFNNQQGQVSAAKALAVSAGSVDNQQGILSGDTLELTATTGQLNNREGTLLSNANSTINVQGLDNAGGSVHSNGVLSINTNGVLLDNQLGKVSANTLAVNSGDIHNQQGLLSANTQAKINAGNINSQGGVIQAGNSLSLNAADVNNDEGLIYAQQADLNVQQLSNQRTKAQETGIQAEQLRISADSLNNNQGQIVSGQDLPLTVRDNLSNSQGIISSNGVLSIGSDSNTQASISNDQGRIQAAGDVAINASELNSSGDILSNGSLNLNVNGDVIQSGNVAAQQDLVFNAKQVSNSGNIQAGGNLQTNSSHWNNNQGVIEANRIVMHTGNLSNQAGRIQQNGFGDFNMEVGAGLLNQEGVIGAKLDQVASVSTPSGQTGGSNTGGTSAGNSGNGNATSPSIPSTPTTPAQAGELVVTGALNNSQGEILANGTTQLSGKGQFTNQQGVVSVQELEWISNSGFSNQKGHINANSSTVKAQSVNNTEGQWFNQKALSIAVTEALDNSQGQLVAGGNTDLSAKTFNNSTGQLVTSGQLNATVAQALINQQGLISANEALTVKAGSLDNSKGSVASAKDTVSLTATQAFNNQQGQVSAAKALAVSAGSVDNQQGILSGDTLELTATTGQLNNREGTLLSNANSTINVQGLDNAGGSVHSNGVLSIDTNGLLLDNQLGSITSLGSIDVDSGVFNNNDGLLQSSGQVRLDTAGQDLYNQATANKGILAGGLLNLNVGNVDNQQGAILSGQSAQIAAQSINNGSGNIQAVADLDLNVQADVDNQAGSILAGEILNIQAQTINNSGTQGSGQGLQGQSINVQAVSLDNQQGSIVADENATLKLTNTLDNRKGKITAAKQLSISGQSGVLASTLNQQGDLIAGELLKINTQTLDNAEGKIQSLGSLDVSIGSDFHTAKGQIEANGDAHLKVNGSLTNSDSLVAGGKLSISSQDLINEAQAKINGGDTELSISNGLINQGLIDGQNTFIQAKDIVNSGEHAKIYGDHLAIKADTLLNDIENGKAGTIAARERLDLGIKDTLRNREHGLIFSSDSMSIAGDLDANHHAIGEAQAIHNNSATIESLGEMQLNTKELHNTNEHFKTEMVQIGDPEHIIEYEAEGRNERLREGTQQDLGWYVFNDESDHLRTPDGATHEKWHRYNYMRTTEETRVVETDPGKIIAGGKLTINADEVWNNDSQIIAGDKLTVNVKQGGLHNNETTGERIVTDKGCAVEKADGSGCYANYLQAQADGVNVSKGRWSDWSAGGVHYFWRDHQKGRDSTGHSRGDYLPAPEITKGLSLGSFAFEENTQVSSNNNVASKDGIKVTGNIEQANQASGPNGAQNQQLNQTQEAHVSQATNGQQQADEVKGAGKEQLDNQSIDHSEQIANKDAIEVADGKTLQQQAADIATTDGLNVNAADDVSQNQVDSSSADALSDVVIRTAKPNVQLPSSGLYAVDAQSGSHLIETDPRFTDYRKWLSSDYMLVALNLDPNLTQKRLGDGFYEQRLLREQIASLTGRRYLDGYDNDEEQFKALMDSGISAAYDLNLTPGVALSAEQIARLTSDIVWMVEQTVTLEDGSSAKVLVPQVYVRVLPGDINGNGALLSGRVSELNIKDSLTNSGTVAGRQALRINSDTVNNINGRISANQLAIHALNDINNVGGTIDAANTLLLQAGRDINNVTTTTTNTNAQGSVTNLNRVAGIYITGAENGVLLAQAGNNINIDAAQLINQSAGGQTLLKAGNDINLGTTTISRHQENRLNADNYIIRGNQTDIGSNIQTSGDLSLVAGRDINAKAAQVNSSLGQLDVLAGRDVNLSTGNHYTLIDDGSKHTGRSGGGNKQVETSKIHINDQQTLATDFGGNIINVKAGNDVNVIGSSIISDTVTNVYAGRNVNILAAEEHNETDSFYSKKKSGLMSSGGIGFTVGSVKETTENTSANVRHAASTVGSLQGDTNIIAQEKYTQTGSIVSSPEGTVNIVAKQVDIEAAKDQYASDYKHTFEQKGFTVAVNIPVVNAVQGAVSAIQSFDKIGDSKNDRVNAMAAANSAWGTYKAGQGLADIANDPKAAASQDVSVSITYGEQKNVDQTKTQGTLASASQINAGNQVNIVATGAGKDSNINIIGSDLAGKGGTNLYADNEVNIKSAEQVHQERSENKSEGWNAGVAISYGQGGFAFGVTAGGNYGKGYGNGDEVTYRNSHVGDENSKTSIISGGVTTIAGGQVVGKSVHLDAAALNIESQQDTLKFEGEQQNIEGQITVGYGVSGSASYSQSKVNADYAAVREQSGIFAGDDGYQINVKEQTHLKGGLITSTKAAEDAGKNHFSTGSIVVEDIQNHANYDASGFGIGGSASFECQFRIGRTCQSPR
jgi:filamentous hemagglutinin